MRRLVVLSSLTVLTTLSLAAVSPVTVDAQSFGDRLKKRAEEAAKRKVEERTEKRAGEAADKALDKAECAATDRACQQKAEAAAQGGGDVTPAGASSGASSLKPGEGAWANYDFKPGERILYADDFMKDEVGDFPKRMEFKEGALEVVEWQGQRFLRATSTSKFFVVLPEVLPERYTLEFDYTIPAGAVWISITDKDDYEPRLEFGGSGTVGLFNRTTKVFANGQYGALDYGKIRRGRIMVDGNYAKVYVDDKRILNVPNANLGHAKKLLFYMDASNEKPALFGNFRVAAGGKKLYDALAEKGRVATQGIYFDTGSDRIRPESTPTLKEIGQMLTEHSDLNLTIEGHTDNVGGSAANQTLSEKRAAAVKAYLVDKHGIDAARLKSAGFGDKKPAAPNSTPEGRQQNRRVELVKM